MTIEDHIYTITLLSLFTFLLIAVNSVWDQWMPYGGYLFFIECLALCTYVAVKGRLSSNQSRELKR